VKSNVAEQEGTTVRLEIEVSAEEVQEGLDTTLKQLAREARIPGFRKGKVPLRVAEQRFGAHAIVHQMLEDYLSRWYGSAVDEAGIEPVDTPEVDYDDEPEPGRPFSFKVAVTVMPVPVLGEYKGLEVPRQMLVALDEDVDARVERLREEFAELRVVSDRSVRKGDFLTIDAKGMLDGAEVESATVDDYAFEVGAGRLLADLEEGVVGMAAGEEKAVLVVFPEDYPSDDLAGKTLDFTVTVKEVKEKVLPAMNDEFAKDVSEFETLLELRLDIRGKLQAAKDSAAERAFRGAAVKAATDAAMADLPAVVVDRQAQEMVEDFARSLTMQGGDFSAYLEKTGVKVEQMLADVRPEAEATVKTSLVLDAIVAAEGLEAGADEVEARVAQMATAGRLDAGEVRSRLEESGRIQSVRQQLLREKAADLIVQHAVAVAPPVADVVAVPEADSPEADRDDVDVTTVEETADSPATD
jgi:trigger factor